MGEYADESVVDVASSATMVRMVFFIIRKCFVLSNLLLPSVYSPYSSF